VLETVGAPAGQLGVELSPDGEQAATFRSGDVWVMNLTRPVPNRVTRGSSRHPVWSPDGRRIASTYQGRGIGTFDLEVTTPATGGFTTLLQSTANVKPLGWTRNGQTLVFNQMVDKSTARGIWMMRIDDSKKGHALPAGLCTEPGSATVARRPMDCVYHGPLRTFEIEVRSFPVPGARYPVSIEGGGYPRWRADGRELYFYEYDVTADGSRFLVNRLVSEPDTSMAVTVDWSPPR
jgi:hypothetical protein